MPASTIDEVIDELTAIIEWSRKEHSRLGYFAALYRTVTVEVKKGIQAGRFQDGPRMEKLDVAFANRYLDALRLYRAGQPTTECWQIAFDAASTWRPLILQHLLAGMNAHINFDLGVSAATVAPGADLSGLQHDFEEINKILASLTNEVQTKISRVSPWMTVLDWIGGRTDEAVVNFSIDAARKASWRTAQRLAATPQSGWPPALAELDRTVMELGRLVLHPGWFLSTGLLVVRIRETQDIGRVIDALT